MSNNIPKKPTGATGPADVKPKVKPVNVQNNLVNKQPTKKSEDKKDKKKRLLILLLLLLFVVIVGVAILVYFLIKPNENINLQLTITTKINGEIIGPSTTMPDKKFIPGDEIPVEVNFKIYDPTATNSNAKVVARYKISAFVDDTYVSGLFDPKPIQGNTLNVIKGDDNYFYYKTVFYSSDEDIVAFRALDFVAEYDNNILNGKTASIKIELEILEANSYAIESMWVTRPNNWKNEIKSQLSE